MAVRVNNQVKLKISAQRPLSFGHFRGKLQDMVTQGVSVITCTNRPSFMEKVFSNYLRQTYTPKELIVVLHNNSMNIDDWRAMASSYPDVRVFQLDERISLGECYNFAVEHSRFEFIAKFDDDDYYAPRYLTDSINTFRYTDAGIVGKSSRYIYFENNSTLALCTPSPENSYAEYVVGATMIIKKDVFRQVKFQHITCGEDSEFQKECSQMGIKIFSGDKNNYVTIRHSGKESHTFQIDDDTYLNRCQVIARTRDYVSVMAR
jgi:hypothetical protein